MRCSGLQPIVSCGQSQLVLVLQACSHLTSLLISFLEELDRKGEKSPHRLSRRARAVRKLRGIASISRFAQPAGILNHSRLIN